MHNSRSVHCTRCPGGCRCVARSRSKLAGAINREGNRLRCGSIRPRCALAAIPGENEMKRLTVALLLSAVGAFPVCAQSYIQQVGPASSDNTLTFTPSPIIGGSGSMCSSGCGTIQLNLNNADTWTATPSFGAGLQITGPTGPADNYDWLRIIATSSPMITGGNSIIDVVGVVSPAGTAQTNISGLTVNYKMSGCSGCTTTNYLGINIVPIIDPSF